MTRKDYILLAEALKVPGDYCRSQLANGYQAAELHAAAVADALAADNPRFDRARFLKTAGVTP